MRGGALLCCLFLAVTVAGAAIGPLQATDLRSRHQSYPGGPPALRRRANGAPGGAVLL